MPDIGLCTPNGTYFIVERVYVVNTSHTPGPSARKVTRHVAQTCDRQHTLYNGEIVDGMPTPWQYLMDALGLATLSYRPTGETSVVLMYAGFENLFRPLPAELKLGFVPDALGFLFEEHSLDGFGPFIYGEDPIPEVRLFGDPSVQFYSAGGNEPPTAMAIYHGDTGRLEHVPPNQLEIMLRQLGITPASSSSSSGGGGLARVM